MYLGKVNKTFKETHLSLGAYDVTFERYVENNCIVFGGSIDRRHEETRRVDVSSRKQGRCDDTGSDVTMKQFVQI